MRDIEEKMVLKYAQTVSAVSAQGPGLQQTCACSFCSPLPLHTKVEHLMS